jgi:hypothetical protein
MRFILAALSVAALASLAGCSEPIPMSPDGAFLIHTQQDDPQTCLIMGNTAQCGAVDETLKKANGTLTDGVDGTKVSCSVIGTGPYEVAGTLDDTGNTAGRQPYFLDLSIPALNKDATKDNPATGTLSFSAPWTATPYNGTCNFYFTGAKERVTTGAVWFSFDCPSIGAGESHCPVVSSVALFENCLTEATTSQ